MSPSTSPAAAFVSTPQPATTTTAAPSQAKSHSVLRSAKLISALTLLSRLLGLLRESIAARYFGAGIVSSAFTVAFTIPNLFRRLFGEGALSAAFIPLYSQSLKSDPPEHTARFASDSVNLLIAILALLTLFGEGLLLILALTLKLSPDRLLALKLTAVMLPYALFICAAAFLGAILQTHRRFGLTAFSPVLLNVALIASTVAGAYWFGVKDPAQQSRAIFVVAVAVLLAGAAQVLIVLPDLRAVGFRFQPRLNFWTPAVRKMLHLSIPVALAAAVLQASTLLDRFVAFLLARPLDPAGHPVPHFTLLGHTFSYPLATGAAARLAWAQYLYQFPLGVFAIALATAIFPALSSDALDADPERFKSSLRRGIRLTLLEGLPCSLGLFLVATPAVQLLFERGQFKSPDTALVARALQVFSLAIWAFSLQQILNRAFYALHDTRTPLTLSIVTALVDLSLKLSLIWRYGEAGMAAGTAVSFTLQTLLMLSILNRRVRGGLGLPSLLPDALKLLAATALMTLACLAVQRLPFYPADLSKRTALFRLLLLMSIGAATYALACLALRVHDLSHLLPNRLRPRPSPAPNGGASQ